MLNGEKNRLPGCFESSPYSDQEKASSPATIAGESEVTFRAWRSFSAFPQPDNTNAAASTSSAVPLEWLMFRILNGTSPG